MSEAAVQSINQHAQKTSLDWLYNVLIQPATGTGSGVAPDTHIQYSLSLDLLRQALVEVGNVVNNITTTVPGKVLDARQGKALADSIAAEIAKYAQPNGIATLGSDGKIPSTQIPSIALVDVFTVESEAAMLASGAEQGDMAIRSDTSQVFILSASPATTIENWIELSALKALVDAAVADLAGSGRTTETVKGNADAIETLNADDTTEGSVAKTVKDAVTPIESRLDTTELTIAQTSQDIASVKQTLQQGNGATLDFSDIGIVPIDARATGRANPTVEGLTATNLVENGDFASGVIYPFNAFASIYSDDSLIGNYCLRSVATDVATGGTRLTEFTTARQGDVIIFVINYKVLSHSGDGIFSWVYEGTSGWDNYTRSSIDTSLDGVWKQKIIRHTVINVDTDISWIFRPIASTSWEVLIDGVTAINLTSIFGAGNEPTAADCAKIFTYFDGTKSIQLPAKVRSVSEDESESSTLYIADNEEVRSIQDVQDLLSMVNGEYIYTKKVSTPVSVASGVAVNTTNYPLAKTGGKFAVELTAGGTQIGVIGTDSTSGAGTLRFELATPLTIPLLTSGILQAKPKGTVYFEPYYEGSHQTNASSQITLPYEGTIDKLTGYDENPEPYIIPSTAYTLVGTTLTITGAEENEVFYVELSRSEPLSPEMEVNVLNNEQVTLDTVNGKYYKITHTTANGVPTTVATEVL